MASALRLSRQESERGVKRTDMRSSISMLMRASQAAEPTIVRASRKP